MVRAFGMVGLAAMLALTAGQASAGDPLRESRETSVSDSALEAMGLGGMQAVSRSESEQIRGQGAIAFSLSYAYRPVLFGGSGFNISGAAATGSRFATARSDAFAGTNFLQVFSGGSAFARGR